MLQGCSSEMLLIGEAMRGSIISLLLHLRILTVTYEKHSCTRVYARIMNQHKQLCFYHFLSFCFFFLVSAYCVYRRSNKHTLATYNSSISLHSCSMCNLVHFTCFLLVSSSTVSVVWFILSTYNCAIGGKQETVPHNFNAYNPSLGSVWVFCELPLAVH